MASTTVVGAAAWLASPAPRREIDAQRFGRRLYPTGHALAFGIPVVLLIASWLGAIELVGALIYWAITQPWLDAAPFPTSAIVGLASLAVAVPLVIMIVWTRRHRAKLVTLVRDGILADACVIADAPRPLLVRSPAVARTIERVLRGAGRRVVARYSTPMLELELDGIVTRVRAPIVDADHPLPMQMLVHRNIRYVAFAGSADTLVVQRPLSRWLVTAS